MKVTLFCKCGASATGSIKPDAAAIRFMERFWQLHSGKVCAPCDQKTAANARRRSERVAGK